jgi:hypothetical protein
MGVRVVDQTWEHTHAREDVLSRFAASAAAPVRRTMHLNYHPGEEAGAARLRAAARCSFLPPPSPSRSGTAARATGHGRHQPAARRSAWVCGV